MHTKIIKVSIQYEYYILIQGSMQAMFVSLPVISVIRINTFTCSTNAPL